MTCSNCGNIAHHIMSNEYGEQCEQCSELSVSSKNKTDGIITRNSWRVRRQQSRFEGDIIRPHIYNKNTHREEVNPEFLKRYPDKVKDFFSTDQLVADGFKDMPAKIAKNKARNDKKAEAYKNDTIYSGSSKKAISKFLNQGA